jgi:hypothetical protein
MSFKGEIMEDARDKANKLLDYAELEGSELGEFCSALVNVFRNIDCAGDAFRKATEREIKLQLAYFEKNSEIVDKEVTHTIREIVWKEDNI